MGQQEIFHALACLILKQVKYFDKRRISNLFILGNSYNFDIFYNERHTTASNLKFTTSLFLSCPWYDHCGVCQGNGQSCCTCQPPNPCFTTKCNVTSSNCINTAKSCADPVDACHTVSCDTATGNCVSKAITCDDGNKCTVDSCDSKNGCKFVAKKCDGKRYCLFTLLILI